MVSILETAVVATLGLVVWIAIQGWVSVPQGRSKPERVICRRDSLRFSLRTLLIATTVIAVVLGLVVCVLK